MVFNTGAALLDAVVLATVAKEPEGAYGYKITQQAQAVLELSESTMYPVLRRLQKDGCLLARDVAINGRNRRYYQLTRQGGAQLAVYQAAWETYRAKIDELLGGVENET